MIQKIYWTLKEVSKELSIPESTLKGLVPPADKKKHRLVWSDVCSLKRYYTRYLETKCRHFQPKVITGLGYVLLVAILVGCSPYFNQSKVVDPGKGKPITR